MDLVTSLTVSKHVASGWIFKVKSIVQLSIDVGAKKRHTFARTREFSVSWEDYREQRIALQVYQSRLGIF